MPALTHGRVINGFNSLPRSIESETGSDGKAQSCCGKPIQRLKYRSTRKSLLRVSSKSSNKKYASNVIIGRSYAAKRAISRRVTNKKPIRNSTGEKIGWEICCKDPVETIIYEIPIFTSLAIFSAPAVSGTIIGTVTAISRRNEILTFSIENSSELVITPDGVLSFASASSFTRKELYYATITVSNGDRISTQDIVVNELPLFTSLAIFSAPAVSGATIGTVTATTSGNEILIFSIENSSELVITPGGVLSFTSSSFTRKESFVATITVSNGDRISTQEIVVENTAWGTITGRVIDGYIDGGTVFVDMNGDGVQNLLEPSTTTDQSGLFTLTTSTNGTIIAKGGTDVSTGLPNGMTLKAPEGSSKVTPLTTLVVKIIENKQSELGTSYFSDIAWETRRMTLSVDVVKETTDAVKVALGLNQFSDILNEDFVETGSGSLTKAAAKVANVMSVAKVSERISEISVLQNVATALETASELSVQTNILSNEGEMIKLLGEAAGKVVSAVNKKIEEADDFQSIAKVQSIDLKKTINEVNKVLSDAGEAENDAIKAIKDIISTAEEAAAEDYEIYSKTIVETLPELVDDEDTSTITLSPTVVNAAQNNPELKNAIEAVKDGELTTAEVEDYAITISDPTKSQQEIDAAQFAFEEKIKDLPQYIVGEPAGFTNALNAVRQYLPSEFQPTAGINPVLKLQENEFGKLEIFTEDEIIGSVMINTYTNESSGEKKMTVEFSFFAVNQDFYVDFRKETIENITTKIIITLKNDITIQSKLTIPEISGLKLIIAKGKILTVKKPSTDP